MWQSAIYDVSITMIVMAFVLSPGILLTTTFFPKRTLLWRFAIGNILSFLLLGWGILLLNFLNIKIDYLSLLLTVLFCIVISSLTFLKTHAIKKGKISSAMTLIRDNFWGFPTLVFFLFGVILIIILPIAHAQNTSGFTEFYIAEGLGAKPPWHEQIDLNEPVLVTAVIVNNETTTESYTMHVVTEESILQVFYLGTVQPGDKVAHQIILPPRDSVDQQYFFLLYKGERQDPYRVLSFWLHVY